MSIDSRWRSLDKFCAGVRARKSDGSMNGWLVTLIFAWLLRHNENMKSLTQRNFRACLLRGLKMYHRKYHVSRSVGRWALFTGGDAEAA